MGERKTEQKISWDYIFSYGNNLAINSLIAIFLIFLMVGIISYHRQLSLKQEQPKNIVPALVTNDDEAEIGKIKTDMGNWKKYPNLWYGFELKYPENWKDPVVQDAPMGADWEAKYSFRKKDPAENICAEKAKPLNIADWQQKYLFYKKETEKDLYGGFDVIIYDVEKIKELSDTDEFPTIKNEKLKASGVCDQIEGHLTENENYPAEKIHILSDDDCYNSVFFYSLIREQYIYNIVPVLKGYQEPSFDSEKEAINNFPEFFSVASSFNLIDIKRPKIAPRKPRITAPKPVAATKKVNGMRVCAKKNDHPGKSNQGKKKHLDMECCLDPDEYPNPHCYYPPKKYGKYLK